MENKKGEAAISTLLDSEPENIRVDIKEKLSTYSMRLAANLNDAAKNNPPIFRPMYLGEQRNNIKLTDIRLPKKLATSSETTLYDAIKKHLSPYMFSADFKDFPTTFRPLVGVFPEENSSFSPIFHKDKADESDVIIQLAYTIDGEVCYLDNWLSQKKQIEDFPCSKEINDSDKRSSFDAIPINNATAEDMKKNQPELYTELEKSGYFICFIRLKKHIQTQAYLRGRRGTHESESEDEDVGDIVADGMSHFAKPTTTPNKYAIAAKGPKLDIVTNRVPVSGPFDVLSIDLYYVAPMVVSVTEMPFDANEYIALMKTRVAELNKKNMGWFSDSYTVNDYHDEITQFVANEFGIQGEIDGAVLTVLALLECKNFTGSTANLAHWDNDILKISLPKGSLLELHNKLSSVGVKLGRYAFLTHSSIKPLTISTAEFTLQEVRTSLPNIKTYIREYLLEFMKNDRYLELIQLGIFSKNIRSYHSELRKEINDICAPLSINTRSDVFEEILLKMFGCQFVLKSPECIERKIIGYNRLLDIQFNLEISQINADEFVRKFNLSFPDQAKLAPPPEPGMFSRKRERQIIVISGNVLCGSAFLNTFKEILNTLCIENPAFIRVLQKQSNSSEKQIAVNGFTEKNVYDEYVSKMDSYMARLLQVFSEPLLIQNALHAYIICLKMFQETLKKSCPRPTASELIHDANTVRTQGLFFKTELSKCSVKKLNAFATLEKDLDDIQPLAVPCEEFQLNATPSIK